MSKVSLGKSIWNKLVRSGTAAILHANFDRIEPGQNVDSGDTNRRKPRLLRPGAVILPNLDIDEDPAAPARARFKHTQVDARVDNKVNEGDDYKEITLFEIAEPTTVVGNSDRLTVRVSPEDAKRIRIWGVPKGKTYKEGIEVIGPGTGHEFRLLDQSGWGGLPSTGWKRQFYVEARTLPGDKVEPVSTDKAPSPPGVNSLPKPDESGGSQLFTDKARKPNVTDQSKSVYDLEVRYWDYPDQLEGRAAGDVWIEIEHGTKAGSSNTLKDVGLFTIAPWIMTWNTLKCERVYVAYLAGRAWPNSLDDNHGMVWDLQHACKAAGLVNPSPKAPNADSTKPIKTNRAKEIRKPNDIPFYVIPAAFSGGDRWVQDEFEIGYCWAPHSWLHVVLHNPRGRRLKRFVNREMAHAGLGVYNGLSGPADSVDYGGNLEVSPPVSDVTPLQPRSAAGPGIKEHRRAPFGKIILGDYEPEDTTGTSLRDPCSVDFVRFLSAQMVQPIVPLDTSWLEVGHVDEYMSFVRANDRKGFRLLFGSVRLMTIMLNELKKVDSSATLHRGKYRPPSSLFHEEYVESFATSWLSMGAPTWNSHKGLQKYSKKIEREKLRPIRDRLKTALALQEKDLLSIPMYLKNPRDHNKPLGHTDNRTVAENVGMVNMQVVNDHLMVPRPHGPRLEPHKAKKVVEGCLKRWFGKTGAVPAARMPSPDDHFFWARPGETVEQLAMYFARPTPRPGRSGDEPREMLINAIKTGAALPTHYRNAVADLKTKIIIDPANKNAPTPIDTAAPAPGRVFAMPMRVKIPDGTVDIIEAYMKSILEPLGNTVHFIENFECYHEQYGEVHCGTNAKRNPPELDPAFTDRWWNSGVYDPDFEADYFPDS